MKKIYKEYLDSSVNLDKFQKIGIVCLIVVLSGIFGWIYEFIFYYFNGGMKEFYMQGGNFLPWINIYATGSIMIYLLTRKYKKKPWLIFIISFISTGILEYFSGLVIYKLFNGLRLWDYNTEILNFGNIDGFVCLRSVLFFGVSGLFLVYLMIPFCILLSNKINSKTFFYICFILFFVFMFDEIYNLIIARLFSLPRAYDIYTKLGFKYVNFLQQK